MKSEITLTADEALAAATVGILRQLRVVAKERQYDHGAKSWRRQRDRWANQIHGAMAEFAFSRAIDRAWTPGGREISSGDVSGCFEVRATEMDNDDTCLYVYEHDPDDKWFVLAIGHYPRFQFIGAILGANAKQFEWWNSAAKPPCFYVPRQSLQPLDSIFKQ
jgi:hypothetical protein